MVINKLGHMKFTTIYLDGNCIEVYNTLLGKEIIKVNQKVVSARYSIFGGLHKFEVDGVSYEMSFHFTVHGIAFDLIRNGKAIVESNKGGCFVIIGLIVISVLVFKLIFR